MKHFFFFTYLISICYNLEYTQCSLTTLIFCNKKPLTYSKILTLLIQYLQCLYFIETNVISGNIQIITDDILNDQEGTNVSCN